VAALVLAACGSVGPLAPTDEAGPVRAGLTPRPAGEGGAPSGYYEYLPSGYGEGSSAPLLVFLHGYGGQGGGSADELERILELGGIPQLIQAGRWPEGRPFVVLAPQHPVADESAYFPCIPPEPFPGSCAFALQHELDHPDGGSNCFTPDEVYRFLNFAVDRYEVDPRRVYLTGVSCGAFAVYEYLAVHGATQVTAVVPIAGDARPAWRAVGCDLGAVPIWAFHGDADDVVALEGTTQPLSDLAACPEPRQAVEVTVYPGAGHDTEVRTYNGRAGHDIYSWLLGFPESQP
jgi:predicted peptidase